jgi:hypothetical protein
MALVMWDSIERNVFGRPRCVVISSYWRERIVILFRKLCFFRFETKYLWNVSEGSSNIDPILEAPELTRICVIGVRSEFRIDVKI